MYPVALALALALCAPAAAAAAHPPSAPQPIALAGGVVPPLHTDGGYFVDANGRRVRLRCASWSGGQEKWFVPTGLSLQPRRKIASMARAAGLNCVRLVFSVEAVLRTLNGTASVPPAAVAANRDLAGKTPLEVLDAVIAALASKGLMVIVDNHSSDAIWCCGIQDGNGLWFTTNWSEAQWLQAWDVVARRYANASNVIGVGLRNEPRPAIVGGRFRIPTWGFGGPMSDIAAAYERAGARILAARPSSIVFAQGLLAGRDLRLARLRPLVLRGPDGQPVQGRLAYEAHEYPWLWGRFDFTDYARYASRLDSAWGYVAEANRTPLWLGEFGVEHTQAGINSSWWRAVTRYIKDRDLDWSFWALDGTEGPSRTLGKEETYGLLNMTWDGWAFPPLLAQLWSLV